MKYLEPTDPDAFVDYPKMEYNPKMSWNDTECPKCFGHGGWNLSISQPHFHTSHFRAHCNQCHGNGWLPAANTACIHDLKWVKNIGNCLNLYGCIKCEHTEEWDSSD